MGISTERVKGVKRICSAAYAYLLSRIKLYPGCLTIFYQSPRLYYSYPTCWNSFIQEESSFVAEGTEARSVFAGAKRGLHIYLNGFALTRLSVFLSEPYNF